MTKLELEQYADTLYRKDDILDHYQVKKIPKEIQSQIISFTKWVEELHPAIEMKHRIRIIHDRINDFRKCYCGNPISPLNKKQQYCSKKCSAAINNKSKYTTEKLLTIFKTKHKEKFEYPGFVFNESTKLTDKIKIVCPKHGEFSQQIASHKAGIGCEKCGIEKRAQKRTLSKDEWVVKFKKIHSKYNYGKIQGKKIQIFCPNHGEFWQTMVTHNKGQGCPKCGITKTAKSHINSNVKVLARLESMGTKYNYSKVDCTRGSSNITIICPEHGEFKQSLWNHYAGTGCPRCNMTKAEVELAELIEGCKQNDRTVIKPLELDILSIEHKFAIEYNGLMWHSFGKSRHTQFNTQQYEKQDKFKHLTKTEMCEDKGVQLFHIFENEWFFKKDIWKSVINSKLNRTARIYARKCKVKEISYKQSREFEELNHLQGKGVSSVRIGLFYNNELVQVMTFGKARFSKQYQYELIRMCTKLNTSVVGGASKLLKYFERTCKPKSIVSYANRRWSQGNVYEKLGFEHKHNSEPNYFYFKPNETTLMSRNKFQKHKLEKQLDIFDKNLTEAENMYNNNYRKIYDCGNKVYVKEYINT